MTSIKKKMPGYMGRIMVILSIIALTNMLTFITIDYIDYYSRFFDLIIWIGIGILGYILIYYENRKVE